MEKGKYASVLLINSVVSHVVCSGLLQPKVKMLNKNVKGGGKGHVPRGNVKALQPNFDTWL